MSQPGRINAVTNSVTGAKLEMLNPAFSRKDRAALRIIGEAERRGDIRPGDTVVELTNGIMGTGLANVCTVGGCHFVAVMLKGNSREQARERWNVCDRRLRRGTGVPE